MKLRVKSHGGLVEMSDELYKNLPQNQKMNYEVVKDAPEGADKAPVKKTADNKKPTPPTGEKKDTEVK